MNLVISYNQGIAFENLPCKKFKILYQDKIVFLKIQEDEEDKCFFYETSDVWCLVFGRIFSINSDEDNLDNIARTILGKFLKNYDYFLNEYDGEFLIVIFDKKMHKLFVLKDTLGLKHAYYTITSEGFCLTTSVKEILKFRKNLTTKIDLNSLNIYLTFQYLPNPYTMFVDIYQLPSRKMLIYYKNKVSTKSYKCDLFLIDKEKSFSSSIPFDIKTLLIESFNKQITNKNLRIGAFLSGGMDTSSNVALLFSELGIKPVVFTASFQEVGYDETPYAQIMAEYYNLEHHIVNITKDVVYSLPKISALYSNPIADRAILAEYIICNMAKEIGVQVMVSGEGGDEILGYPRNLPENLIFNKKMFLNNKLLAEYYYSFSSLMSRDIRKSLIDNVISNKEDYLLDLYSTFKSLHPFEKIYYGQWQTWLIDNVLMKDLQLFNYSNLIFVSPYINKSLMNYMIFIPTGEKIEGLRNKQFLKKGLEKLLPNEIINKKKHKFHVPISEWFRGKMYDFVYESLLSVNSFCVQYMNKKIVGNLLQEHKTYKLDHNRPLWALLFLEFWHKNMISCNYNDS